MLTAALALERIFRAAFTDAAPAVFDLGHERFGNAGVDVLAKAHLAPSNELEPAPDALETQTMSLASGCLLKPAAPVVPPYPAHLDVFSGGSAAVTVYCDIRHAQVDADLAVRPKHSPRSG